MTSTSVPKAIRNAIKGMLAEANLPLTCRINFWEAEQVYVTPKGEALSELTLRIRHPGVLRAMLLQRNPLVLAEAYLNGYVDISGKLEALIVFFRGLSDVNLGIGQQLRAWVEALSLPSLPQVQWKTAEHEAMVHTPERDREAIRHHYNVGNAFYRLWLDPLLVYSCAHFESPDMTLAEAQAAKLDLICRKLRLQSGETLLDIGCGWGALLRWAAQHYGVKGYGITLSEEQLAFNQQQSLAEHLEDQIQVELLDYRDLPKEPSFDKIVSIGMIEHVGLENYPTYFSRMLAALKPGGLFLNHSITTRNHQWGTGLGEQFIERYIFPDGELVQISTMLREAEKAGWEIVDVDSWRPHYAKTLRHWAANLEQANDEAIAHIGERQLLIWKLYLIGSALGFERNDIGIYQMLLRKQSDRTWDLPLTRHDWLV